MKIRPNATRPVSKCLSRFSESIGTNRVYFLSSVAPKGASQLDETSHFNQLALSWWDVRGPQRILHKMNLVRMDFIQQTLKNGLYLNSGITDPSQEVYVPGYNTSILPPEIALEIEKDQKNARNELYEKLRLKVLDIGCGGGILSESLARLDIVESVEGIDLAQEVIKVAKQHKDQDPKIVNKIKYQQRSLDSLEANKRFDVVTMFEILEHVDDPKSFLSQGLSRLEKNGVLFLLTINKDFISWFTTIFIAEYVLGIVPVGTHHLEKYVDYSTIEGAVEDQKRYEIVNSAGGAYLPFVGWFLHGNANLGNYFVAIKRVN